MLVDEAIITVQGGSGGDGIVSWRREKFIDRGGPDGGDGGKGGDVLVVADHNVSSLEKFRAQKEFKAQNGENGQSKKRHGGAGEDLLLRLPWGTEVRDASNQQELINFGTPSKELAKKMVCIAKGGRGGWGNTHFVRPDQQAPECAVTGRAGETRLLLLRLNLLADVALVGLPNAGKSSLLKALTGKSGKIASYAFSTTEPLLGVWLGRARRLVFVDLPGLIAGAHQGRGLGDKFLHHLGNVKTIVHLIDSTNDNLDKAKETIESELAQYDQRLSVLPTVLCLTKIDLLQARETKRICKRFPYAVAISAKTGEGLNALTDRLCRLISPDE